MGKLRHLIPVIRLLLDDHWLWAGVAIKSVISVNLNLINLFQSDRADNVLSGTKQEMMQKIRNDIKDFKEKKNLDKVF